MENALYDFYSRVVLTRSFSDTTQVVNKNRTKHFPCCNVFISYVLRLLKSKTLPVNISSHLRNPFSFYELQITITSASVSLNIKITPLIDQQIIISTPVTLINVMEQTWLKITSEVFKLEKTASLTLKSRKRNCHQQLQQHVQACHLNHSEL